MCAPSRWNSKVGNMQQFKAFENIAANLMTNVYICWLELQCTNYNARSGKYVKEIVLISQK